MKREISISQEEAIDRISELKGAIVSHAWKGHGSAIFLELGNLENNPRGNNPNGEQTIMIEWSWRVEDENSILVGSWSESENIDRVPKLLIGSKIENICFFGRLPELNIQLNNSHWLLTFMTEKGNPEWSIKFRNEEWLSFNEGGFKIEQQI